MAGIHFSLWGYIKEKVYAQPIADIADLKEKIREAFKSVPLYMLSNVFGGFKVRLEDCIKVAGAHIEHCRKKTCEDCNRH